ncbi:MAG: gliding motility-associated C-terminal domain-containing protein, partial [Sphingobacteriales bacterium]
MNEKNNLADSQNAGFASTINTKAFSGHSIYGNAKNTSAFFREIAVEKFPRIYFPLVAILFSPFLFFFFELMIRFIKQIMQLLQIKFSVIILFLLLAFSAKASHLVGGNFSLQHIGGTQYKLTLKVFRDCENGIADFNKDVTVGMYDKANDKLVRRIFMGNIVSNEPLVFVGDNCINIPTGCTSIGTYNALITLDPDAYNSISGYYFSWERCCRNTIIQNIVVGNQPGTTGEVYYMEIPPLNIINSTPVFNRNPLTLLCVNTPFSFNYDATDADGDSLVYTLVTPLKGFTTSKSPNDDTQKDYPLLYPGKANTYRYRYPEVQWKPGYNLEGNIMDANPKLEIDRNTGQLEVTPTRQGIYVISIRVEEYRNGIRLGEVRLDLQLTISSCNTNTTPKFNPEAYNKTYIVNATDTLQFPVIITDANGDSLYLEFDGTVFGESPKIKEPYATFNETKGKAKIASDFSWITTCEHATGDTQTVNFRVRDNGCPIHKSAFSTIKIIVLPPPTPLPPAMACLERPDENTLRINFGEYTSDKYFVYYLLMRKNPDSTETIIDTVYRDDLRTYIIDDKAFSHAKNHYKYYFIGVNICGEFGKRGYYVNSDPGIPFEPAERYITRTTVKDNKYVLVEWEEALEDNFKSYQVYRKINFSKDSFELYKSIYDRAQKYFIDSAVDVQQKSYCYKILVLNYCGYKSKPSNKSCSILLQGEAKPFENHLNWNPYIEWKGGVESYKVVRRDDGTPDSTIAILPNPSVSFIDDKLNIDWGAYWYKIVAKEGNGSNTISESNEVYLIQEPMVYPPNAFTPNNDGNNDAWGILPVFVKDYHLKVFNRWGQVVFEANNKHKQWNGIYNTNDAFNNVYIWQIEYTGWDSSRHYINGNVTTYK